MLKIILSLLIFYLLLPSCNREQSSSDTTTSEPNSVQDVSFYKQGLEQGYGAAVAAQSANSKDAWKSVEDQWGQAITSLGNVSPDSPDHQAAQLKIEEYTKNLSYAQSMAESFVSAFDYVVQGGQKYIANDFTGAIQDYNKAVELDPTLAQAYFNRGEAWIRLNNNVEAIRDFEKAIQLYQEQNDEGGAYQVTTRLNDLKEYGR